MPLPVVVILVALAVSAGAINPVSSKELELILSQQENIVEWIYAQIIEGLDALSNLTDHDVLQCLVGMGIFVRSLEKGDMWALKMFDSSAKLQSGILMGNMKDPGQYDECVNIKADFSNSSFSGMHCLVDVNIKLPSNASLNGNSGPFATSSLSFTMGQCFPSICKPWVINAAYNKISNMFINNATLNIKINPSDCHLSQRGDLTAAEWIVLIIILILSFVAAVCTILDLFAVNKRLRNRESEIDIPNILNNLSIYDFLGYHSSVAPPKGVQGPKIYALLFSIDLILILRGAQILNRLNFVSVSSLEVITMVSAGPTNPERIVLSFSLHNNWNRLMSTKTSDDSMVVINGLKCISMCWVVYGHKFVLLLSGPVSNLADLVEAFQDWNKMLLFSAPLSVDTFFFMAGLLNMFVFCFIRENKKKFSIFDIIISYIHRYIRLTPAYAMMIAITATWLYRSGNGPFWDRAVAGETNQCSGTKWWPNILYVNNYVFGDGPIGYCLMQSWYLSADMQMFWLAPIVVYPLWRWPWFGYIEVFILTCASIASPFLVSYYFEIPSPLPLDTTSVKDYYFPMHTRTAPYIVGILSGYLLYQFKKNKIKFYMNKYICIIGWIISAILMLYAIFGGHYIIQFDHKYNKWESAFYIGFFRFFWSLGLAWLVICCSMGYGGIINTLLSLKIYGPLGRLTYCIYLTHAAVLMNGVGSTRVPAYYSDYTTVKGFFGDMIIVLVCSVILTLLLESPIMGLEKILLGGIRPTSQKKTNQNAESPTSTTATENEMKGA